jgi:uncharacterized damage-inducible protein DinB
MTNTHMKKMIHTLHRRDFIKKSAVLTAGFISFAGITSANAQPLSTENDLLMIGPMEGYSPHIGTIVSMLNYNRQTIINTVKDLKLEEVDYLIDQQANTIGALIMHLGAVDKFYQINTFEGRQEFNDDEKKIWEVPMKLGEEGRKQIKGKEVKYYLELIAEVRQKTLEEFKKKDDAWLLAKDPVWSEKQPVNTYWKWFHVCEHESNHRGQMTWLKKRLPGSKKDEGE